MDVSKGRVFSIGLHSPGAARLREAVNHKLSELMGSYTDDVLVLSKLIEGKSGWRRFNSRGGAVSLNATACVKPMGKENFSNRVFEQRKIRSDKKVTMNEMGLQCWCFQNACILLSSQGKF
eukprot:Gb_38285 [translate_table: standard]